MWFVDLLWPILLQDVPDNTLEHPLQQTSEMISFSPLRCKEIPRLFLNFLKLILPHFDECALHLAQYLFKASGNIMNEFIYLQSYIMLQLPTSGTLIRIPNSGTSSSRVCKEGGHKVLLAVATTAAANRTGWLSRSASVIYQWKLPEELEDQKDLLMV